MFRASIFPFMAFAFGLTSFANAQSLPTKKKDDSYRCGDVFKNKAEALEFTKTQSRVDGYISGYLEARKKIGAMTENEIKEASTKLTFEKFEEYCTKNSSSSLRDWMKANTM